jgi:hypothetical protein
MALHETWHLRSRARQCSATETPFTEGQPIVTALFPDPESSGYLRRDFTEHAWKGRTDGDEKPFSHWRTIYSPVQTTETPQAVTKQGAEELLRSLVEEDQEHTENTRYILALMLERQKLLRETDSQPTSGGTLRIYEHRKTGEVFIVKDPNTPLDEVEKIQEEVILLLSPQTIAEEAEGEAKDEAAKGQELIQEPSSSEGGTEKNETPQIASDT